MYPTTHCHFCNQVITYSCDNLECYQEHHYRVGFDTISFEIKPYHFKFYFYPDPIYNTSIVNDETGEKIRAKDHVLVNKENYLQVIDRLKKLQAFQ